MSKIIIGIHGLKNKPSKRLLKKWWKKALKEGLRAIGHPRLLLRFELVYWADYFYTQPLSRKIKDQDHPLFIDDPYFPSKGSLPEKKNKLRQKLLDYLERQMDGIFFNSDLSINFSSITDLIIRRFFKDLDTYYSKNCLDKQKQERPAKKVIRDELADALRKHKNKEIMLISHSMGSIIAYDVLTEIEPDIKIHTFVTMGSPLGMPFIMSKNYSEQKKLLKRDIERSTTPESVQKKWYNFSDLDDKVALNYNLGDDYDENSLGVKAIDETIYNDYVINGERKPHKSYGYLRAPEFSQVLWEFLTEGQALWFAKWVDRVNRVFQPERKKQKEEVNEKKQKKSFFNFIRKS